MLTLFTAVGQREDVTPETLHEHLQTTAKAFWLDIEAPSDDELHILTDVFHFHPLTIEDVKHQNQRPKLEGYDGYMFAVLFVAAFDERDVTFREHHLYIGGNYLVTVHNNREPAFPKLLQRMSESPENTCRKASFLAYLVLDVLVDATFDALELFDDDVDKLQDDILDEATTVELVQLQNYKHGASELRRVLTAQRDMLQRLVTQSIDQDRETTAYYRDIYDHVIRQYETVDSLRDLLTGAMDVYLSTVSNRLNSTMKALTVIASLFLPLTFLTGFFGMNFAWLVSHIDTAWSFTIAIAFMLGSVILQLVLFRRRGWI